MNEKTTFKVPLSALFIALLITGAPRTWGYTNPIETQTVETVTTFWDLSSETLYVGQITHGNTMIVTNSGQVSSYHAYIGGETNASNNRVTVTGLGSSWSNESYLVVGDGGSGNRLDIIDGGLGTYGYSHIGAQSDSSNNVVTVSGADSKWHGKSGLVLHVGSYGHSNLLLITNGGSVKSAASVIGWDTGSSNNWVKVSGWGSSWSNDFGLSVGEYGPDNRLDISDGGRVRNGYGHIGAIQSSSNNMVHVQGESSLWYSSQTISVGSGGRSNRLYLTDGGRVHGDDGYVGGTTNSINNIAEVSGNDSLWDCNQWLAVGYAGGNNRLDISNQGRAEAEKVCAGYHEGVSHNLITVSGAGSVLEGLWDVYVGYYGNSNELQVTSGAQVHTGDGYIGYYESASNCMATVSGSGSVWSNADWMVVGERSQGNRLTIIEGGVVQSLTGYIGRFAGASNNTVIVDGVDSSWEGLDFVYLGEQGRGNTLSITNGGLVYCYQTLIGSAENRLYVSGTDSTWDGDYLTITGSYNEVTISDGGYVWDVEGHIGSVGDTNLVRVSGTNSYWENNLYLNIGNGGNIGNRLEVDDFGQVSAFWARVYQDSTVELGPGSLLTSSYSMTLYPDSTLTMGISGDSWMGHGNLAVGSAPSNPDANVSGTLEIVFLGGYIPTSATTYDLFDWIGGVAGSFDPVLLPVLPSGFSWNTNDLYVGGTLSIEEGLTDTDGDGMPDQWELDYFSNPTNASPTGHGDTDPFNNLAEYIAGTDPTDGSSFFKSTNAWPDVTGFVIEWTPCISNREYSVLHEVSLTNSLTNLAAGIEFPQNSYTDTTYSAESKGFYRVEVQLK